MFLGIAPMFLVDDVDATVSYYTELFQAKLRYTLPQKPPYEWVSLLLGEVEIMIWARIAVQREYPNMQIFPEAPRSQILYIYVDDVDALFASTKDQVTVVMEPKDQFYGIREFTIQDRFNRIFTFAQV